MVFNNFYYSFFQAFVFSTFKPYIFPPFPKNKLDISYEYFVVRKCFQYLVVHVADTEPSVHVYWRHTASQTALQLPQKNGSISELLHIITDGTRYTEHTVDVHSNQT